MASKRRMLDHDLFAHPAFRRATLVEREVWIGIITMADDEGRLRADTLAILEAVFSRAHTVSEDDVRAALQHWQAEGWLLLYGEGDQYGFLTGWYEHQSLDKRMRDTSSLPPPPCPLCSWEAADMVCQWYRERAGGDTKTKTWATCALRAFFSLTEREQNEILPVKNGKRTRSLPVKNALNGSKGKLRESSPQSPPPGGETGASDQQPPEPPVYPPSDYSHMEQSNYPEVTQAIHEAQPEWEPWKVKSFALDCIRAIEDRHTPVDRDELLDWLEGDDTAPSSVDRGDGWLRRMLAQRGERQRAAATASPAASPATTDEDPRMAQVRVLMAEGRSEEVTILLDEIKGYR